MEKFPLELNKLAIDRTTTGVAGRQPAAGRRYRWLIRYLLPVFILTGFAILVLVAAGKQFLPAQPVSVLPVVIMRAETQGGGGEALFQAPGWIEPRPTAINVAAMTPGIIEELVVVAGQKLAKGEPIARLVAIDAELAVEQARNRLAHSEGELIRANATLSAARARLEQPVHLQALLADARGALARAETEIAKLPYLIKAAESDLAYAQGNLDNKRSARQAIPENIVAQAEKDFAIALATAEELRQRMPHLEREVLALREKEAATAIQAELLVDEIQQVQEAEAGVRSALALRDEARLGLRQAELALERTVVRSPINGKVLRLVASPGSRVSGMTGTSEQGASTVIEMFDPDCLQVRVDVRLEDVPLVSHGQLARIETASFPEALSGRVLQVTSEANIQKNTLEVKVELINPPSAVGPEMLVTATFIAPVTEQTDSDAGERERVFVPEILVQKVDGNPTAWIVDAKSKARLRFIETGQRTEAGLVEVESGLQFTDRLIVNGGGGLKDGSLVRIVGEDTRLGVN